MGTTTTAAHDLWRLAAEAERRRIRILVEPISGEHFATSASDPGILYRVTGFSCTCKGFLHWQRCTHHAALLSQIGWLPDPEPDPLPPAPAAADPEPPEPIDAACPGEGDRTIRLGGELRVRAAAPAGESAMAKTPVAAPTPLVTREERAAGLAATIDAAIGRLAEQLGAGHTAEFLEALRFYGRFWRYSPTNALLIKAQCPHATRVAGLRVWNELGYSVKKGEKAIYIWCPILKTERDAVTGERVETVVGFRPGPVFDASQLKEIAEKPLPEVFAPLPDDCEPLYRRVAARVEAEGIAVAEAPLPPGVQGVSTGGAITIRPGLDSRNRLFVLLHELAHELAHQGPRQGAKPAAQRELEAEAVAFVVAAVLGLEIPTSRDYLLHWTGSAEQLKASLGTVQRLVRRVLAIVEEPRGDRVAVAA
jgi:hypothetical protein